MCDRVKNNPPKESLLRFLCQLVWGLVSDCSDTLLVWLRIKHWPSIGPAKWNRKPRSDPHATAWQQLIATKPPAATTHQESIAAKAPTCTHQDSFGRSWIVPLPAAYQGRTCTTRVCVQCRAAVVSEPVSG